MWDPRLWPGDWGWRALGDSSPGAAFARGTEHRASGAAWLEQPLCAQLCCVDLSSGLGREFVSFPPA